MGLWGKAPGEAGTVQGRGCVWHCAVPDPLCCAGRRVGHCSGVEGSGGGGVDGRRWNAGGMGAGTAQGVVRGVVPLGTRWVNYAHCDRALRVAHLSASGRWGAWHGLVGGAGLWGGKGGRAQGREFCRVRQALLCSYLPEHVCAGRNFDRRTACSQSGARSPDQLRSALPESRARVGSDIETQLPQVSLQDIIYDDVFIHRTGTRVRDCFHSRANFARLTCSTPFGFRA